MEKGLSIRSFRVSPKENSLLESLYNNDITGEYKKFFGYKDFLYGGHGPFFGAGTAIDRRSSVEEHVVS